MPRAGFAWVGTAIVGVCFAAHFVWPPAAGIAVVGVLMAFGSMLFVLNVPLTRLAVLIAVLLHATALARSSGSLVLGLGAVVAVLPAVPYPFVVRPLGYKSMWTIPVALVGALVLVGISWPAAGWWTLSVVPLMLFMGVGSMQTVTGLGALKKCARPKWKMKIGDEVPDFFLEDRRGEAKFHLSEQRGKHVLIAFMRGDWCPVCHVKMRVYQKEAENLAKHNVTLAIVSPSTGAKAVSFAKDAGLDMMILADPENKVATIFDAIQPKAFQGKDLPLPCSFLVDPEGKLAHASRPDDVASFLDPTAVLRLIEKSPSQMHMKAAAAKTQPTA